ncbi:putative enzyme of the cupin superfamily [Rhizobium leguminosarum bv. trifolii WSM597]|uniref:Putative enzyme of the cupin superfamily n=1 Tax=Rhizobium leguminosarum bv. trifolii WSM597 TaxID=754764 RepID=J0H9R6_RHILT|nr:cupin domain-containing protein [Rhizobium leguminosarum]EJB07150.1 putative enzyme of the cupin superfamily [Rhizobium leguminosarum bv. trifolii WSM597]
MSRLIAFDLANLGTPHESKAPPERLVEGDPSYKTWEQDNVDKSRIRSGIWEATPGATRSIKGETWEYCTILSGVVELIEDGQQPRRFVAGDTFTMRPGFVGTWRTIETVRKLWVIVSP